MKDFFFFFKETPPQKKKHKNRRKKKSPSFPLPSPPPSSVHICTPLLHIPISPPPIPFPSRPGLLIHAINYRRAKIPTLTTSIDLTLTTSIDRSIYLFIHVFIYSFVGLSIMYLFRSFFHSFNHCSFLFQLFLLRLNESACAILVNVMTLLFVFVGMKLWTLYNHVCWKWYDIAFVQVHNVLYVKAEVAYIHEYKHDKGQDQDGVA